MSVDLIIRGGMVIDPFQGLHELADVAVRDGKIAEIGKNIQTDDTTETVDATGKYVCPGLIDIHTHIYPFVTTWGVEADPTCLARGVTAPVDAGSSSWVTFDGFRELSVKRSKSRVFGFVHVGGLGLVYGPVGELHDMRYAAPEETAECILDNPDVTVGVKVRQGGMQVGENGVEPLRMAVKAAELANSVVMVHIGSGVPLPDILGLMRAGDIVTHCYQGRGDTILDDGGKLLPEVIEARERGIIFDVGHGAGSLKFDTVRAAFESHFFPDVISSDLHVLNHGGPVFDLITTMSKFLHFGLDLHDVVEKTTVAAARSIGRQDEVGSLAVGRDADIAILEIEDGEFDLMDTHANVVTVSQLLKCAGVVRAGEVVQLEDFADYQGREPKPNEWKKMIRDLESVRPDVYARLKSQGKL